MLRRGALVGFRPEDGMTNFVALKSLVRHFKVLLVTPSDSFRSVIALVHLLVRAPLAPNTCPQWPHKSHNAATTTSPDGLLGALRLPSPISCSRHGHRLYTRSRRWHEVGSFPIRRPEIRRLESKTPACLHRHHLHHRYMPKADKDGAKGRGLSEWLSRYAHDS